MCGCSKSDAKKDAKKDGGQASAKKDHKHDDHEKDHKDHDHDKDHKDHDHDTDAEHPNENDADDHSPSDKPLVIVDDVVAASNGHAKEEFANDHARVVAVELHAREGLPLHKGGPRVVYAQSDLNFKFIDVHGDHVHSHKAEWKRGSVHSHGPGAHGIENLADAPAKFLIFLRKAGEKFTASVPADAKTITESTKFATKLLSNDEFRVIKVALPPGEKTGEHYALNRLVYALGSGKLTYTDAEGKQNEQELVEGKTSYHDAGLHEVENTGSKVLVFLVIEMKK